MPHQLPPSIAFAKHLLLWPITLALLTGCGAATVRHVPKLGAITGKKMADLRGSQPIDLKSGQCSREETKIGTVGVGKVVGSLQDWTDATVEAARKNLVARGATISPGAPKTLTITMIKAEVKGIPLTGVSHGKILLAATNPDGLNSTVEGSNSSMAPHWARSMARSKTL